MRNPRSHRSDLSRASGTLVALALVVAGCSSHPTFETALAVPTTPRQPDGVLVEPPAVLPRAEGHATAGDAVVSLRPPISDEQIVAIVRAYVHALVAASIEEMTSLFTNDAVSIAPVVPGQPANRNLRDMFRNRMQPQGPRGGNPFATLRGLEIAQLEHLERFDWTDLSKTSDPPRPNEMRDGDLYVRVPLVAPLGPNGDKLVGDYLHLMLRRDAEAQKIRIAGVAEVNAN